MYDLVFQKAVEQVLAHEGGFVDDTDDLGGATNFGVTVRTVLALGSVEIHAEFITAAAR